MAQVPKKKAKKIERNEKAVEATLSIRLNSTGAMIDYECGNADCQEQVQETEEIDFDKTGKISIDASPVPDDSEEGAKCAACKTENYNTGFTITKL